MYNRSSHLAHIQPAGLQHNRDHALDDPSDFTGQPKANQKHILILDSSRHFRVGFLVQILSA